MPKRRGEDGRLHKAMDRSGKPDRSGRMLHELRVDAAQDNVHCTGGMTTLHRMYDIHGVTTARPVKRGTMFPAFSRNPPRGMAAQVDKMRLGRNLPTGVEEKQRIAARHASTTHGRLPTA